MGRLAYFYTPPHTRSVKSLWGLLRVLMTDGSKVSTQLIHTRSCEELVVFQKDWKIKFRKIYFWSSSLWKESVLSGENKTTSIMTDIIVHKNHLIYYWFYLCFFACCIINQKPSNRGFKGQKSIYLNTFVYKTDFGRFWNLKRCFWENCFTSIIAITLLLWGSSIIFCSFSPK